MRLEIHRVLGNTSNNARRDAKPSPRPHTEGNDKQLPHQTTSTQPQESSEQVGLRCNWTSLAAFALKRTTRGFKLSFQALHSDFRNTVMLHCISPIDVPSVNNRLQVPSGQSPMVLKDTPQRIVLGLRFLLVRSKPLRELEIFALNNHCFVEIVLSKSLDERTLGVHEFIVLCLSPRKPSNFTQWPPIVYHFG